nr:MAG TPA: Transcriptional regulator, RHH-like, CopG [Caudoviricetes sp.]
MANKGINIKVEEELYKKIKFRALELDKTLKDYILDLIKKDLNKK